MRDFAYEVKAERAEASHAEHVAALCGTTVVGGLFTFFLLMSATQS